MNLLFICSKNKWRSRTAEQLFKDRGRDQVRSAGTDKNARIPVTASLLQWADRIFVMEDKHEKALLRDFGEVVDRQRISVLGIPDEYTFMHPELVEILEVSLEPYWNDAL